MLEQKLIVGRYIDLTNPAIANIPHVAGNFVAQPPYPMTIDLSTTSGSFWKGTKKRTSDLNPGVNLTVGKQHRNCQWLTWLPGAITNVPVGGVDVLTGPMSGCQLVLYNDLVTGALHAGHLGTDVASPTNTTAVKTTWNAFATANPAQVIGGFNPANDWAGPYPTTRTGKKKDGGPAKIFGLLTVNATYYSIFTYQQGVTSVLRIAGVQQIASANLATLQNL